MKVKQQPKQSTARRIFRALSLNKFTGGMNQVDDGRNVLVAPQSMEKPENVDRVKTNSRSFECFQLHLQRDEQLVYWNESLTSPFETVSTQDLLEQSNKSTIGATIDVLQDDGTLVSGLTTTGTKHQDDKDPAKRETQVLGDTLEQDDQVLKQLESVPTDLRKTVNALFSVRAKSTSSHPLLPHETQDLRKDFQNLQESMRSAKDQVDELVTEWSEKSKSGLASLQVSTESSTQTTLTNALLREKVLLDQVDFRNGASSAGFTKSTVLGDDTNQQHVVATKTERDELAQANHELIFAFDCTMKELQEVQALLQSFPVHRIVLDERDGDGAHRAVPESLINAVKALTTTLKTLAAERDLLLLQLRDATKDMSQLREQNSQLGKDNEELKQRLSDKVASRSNDEDVMPSNQIASASLVFTRIELEKANRRITDLERMVLRLQQSQERDQRRLQSRDCA